MSRIAESQIDGCHCFLSPIDGTNSLSRSLSAGQVRSSRIPQVYKNTGIFALFFCSFWVWNLDQEGSRLRKCLKPLECGTAAKYSHARKLRQTNGQTWPRARRWGREIYFCLRMVKSKSGTILDNYWERIGEPCREENDTWGFQVRWRKGAMTVHLVEREQWSVQRSMLPLEEVTPQCFHVGEICSASIKLQEEIMPEWDWGSLYSESTVAKISRG